MSTLDNCKLGLLLLLDLYVAFNLTGRRWFLITPQITTNVCSPLYPKNICGWNNQISQIDKDQKQCLAFLAPHSLDFTTTPVDHSLLGYLLAPPTCGAPITSRCSSQQISNLLQPPQKAKSYLPLFLLSVSLTCLTFILIFTHPCIHRLYNRP